MFYLNKELRHHVYLKIDSIIINDHKNKFNHIKTIISEFVTKFNGDDLKSGLIGAIDIFEQTSFDKVTDMSDDEISQLKNHLFDLVKNELCEIDVAYLMQLPLDINIFITPDNHQLNYAISLVKRICDYEYNSFQFSKELVFDNLPLEIKLWTMFLLANSDESAYMFNSEKLNIAITFYKDLFMIDFDMFINEFHNFMELKIFNTEEIIIPLNIDLNI